MEAPTNPEGNHRLSCFIERDTMTDDDPMNGKEDICI